MSNKNDGYDHRFNINDTYYDTSLNIRNTELYNIIINLRKKELLRLLENDNVSIYRKIYELSKYNPNNVKQFNITNGNLYKDFDFEI